MSILGWKTNGVSATMSLPRFGGRLNPESRDPEGRGVPRGALDYGELGRKTTCTQRGGTRTVRHNHIISYWRQAPVFKAPGGRSVGHSARDLTDGGGQVLVRKLRDGFGLAAWIDCGAEKWKRVSFSWA